MKGSLVNVMNLSLHGAQRGNGSDESEGLRSRLSRQATYRRRKTRTNGSSCCSSAGSQPLHISLSLSVTLQLSLLCDLTAHVYQMYAYMI